MKEAFKGFDEAKLSKNHLKISLVAGMGFFTDAYDLFSISIVLYILTLFSEKNFPLNLKVFNMPLSSYLAVSAIVFAIVGQLIFGFISDHLGRKKVYGLEATILAVGAILSAISPNIYWLIASRALLGIGIGGDYPVSSVIASEYGNVRDRGKLIALVFSNQGLGIIAAVLVGIISVFTLPPSLSWRFILGFGAVPALLVIYFRRKMPETPRFSLKVKKDLEQVERAASYLGVSFEKKSANLPKSDKISFTTFVRRYWKYLAGTTMTWFLMDIALYGTGVYSSFISSAIVPHLTTASLKEQITVIGLPYIVGLPGYFSAVALIDRMGRKRLQILGFFGMSSIYLLTSYLFRYSAYFEATFALFALSFYFINLGPNTTTFVIPAEIYPTERRSTGHGISAAAGKLGAAISVFYFPLLKSILGLSYLFLVLSLISLAGIAFTLLLPETKGVSLEEVSKEAALQYAF